MKDLYNRKIDYLRLSLTDRCQLRCRYCLPEDFSQWLPEGEKLNREEMIAIVRTFGSLGVRHLKLTGGEPLLYPDLAGFIKEVKTTTAIEEVTLTTNGMMLKKLAPQLAEAGLDGINVSLDTLDGDKFREVTRRGGLATVLEGLALAASLIDNVKVNCVLTRELNQDEIVPIAKLARDLGVHVRFIEFMPMGQDYGAVSEEAALKELEQAFGPMKPWSGRLGNGPARYYQAPGFTGRIGFISAVTRHFCQDCNRVRVTCDGLMKTCLFSRADTDLRLALKRGNLTEAILEGLKVKPQKHLFHEVSTNKDTRSMVQIGG